MKRDIWQEFRRDMGTPSIPGAPIIGKGWPHLAVAILIIAVLSYLEIAGSPAWLIAIKGIF
jgi:hypothetical protein